VSKPLLRCPACGFSVFVRPEGWPLDRVRCLDCRWEGAAAGLVHPRRHRSHVGAPKAVVIGVPADVASPAGGNVTQKGSPHA